jgi:putative chitinase
MSYKDFNDIVRLAEANGFHVTSTNGGSHNRGSKHFLGLAIDVRTRDKTAAQVSAFINVARNEGLRVLDERQRPPGQIVWSGPHLHIEIISDRISSLNRPGTTLKKNSTNAEAVKTLQNNLVKLGLLDEDGVDGDFGGETEAAVIAFQTKFNIGVDGEVGNETRNKMNEVLAAQTSDTAAPSAIVKITAEQLARLAPNARQNYKDAFANADTDLAAYGINKNPLRVAHFMAQMLHESGGLRIFIEDMNYRAARIREVWSTRFASVAAAEPFAHNPEKLANQVYGDRMGNNPNNGDGFRFIGRGLIQVTGRESYEKFGRLLGIDLAANPDLAFSVQWTVKIAAEEWKEKNCNPLADADDLRTITRRINGGLTGLSSRSEWLEKTKRVWIA